MPRSLKSSVKVSGPAGQPADNLLCPSTLEPEDPLCIGFHRFSAAMISDLERASESPREF